MTGYGRGEYSDLVRHFTVDTRSTNNRYFEIRCRLPREYRPLESNVTKFVKERIARGYVEVGISYERLKKAIVPAKINKELAEVYYKQIEELQGHLGVLREIEIDTILRMPQVMEIEEEEEILEEIWDSIEPALWGALEGLQEMRKKEGEKLEDDIRSRLEEMKSPLAKIEERSQVVVEEYKEKLRIKLQSLEAEGIVDENRLAMEITLFADRCDISEELVRLKSHLKQMEETLSSPEPCGKKLEFILQEMLRESNTIGSKTSDLDITKRVIAIKEILERIREQARNIE